MGRQHVDEGYYEDEGYDEDWAEGRLSLRHRMWAVLGTSWGTSIAVHLAILLILATIVVASPSKTTEAVLLVKAPPVIETPPDPILPPSVDDIPDLEPDEINPDPVLIEPDEVIPEPPQGESMDNLTTKDLRSDSVDDAYGLTGAPAGRIGLRHNKGAAKKFGFSEPGRKSKDMALVWLARHQAPDGSWQHDYRRFCDPKRGAPCSAPGLDDKWETGVQPHHEVGLTGLALLGYLADGNTHRFGKFKHVVRRGLGWLRTQQTAKGSIGFKGGETMYDHLVATMALCEAYAVSRDFTLKRAAQSAVDFAVAAQNPGLGLRYGVRTGRNDSSVTGWYVLALKAARTADLYTPDKAFQGALAWFDRATNSQGSTGYQTPGGGSSFLGQNRERYDEVPTNTSVAVLCRLFAGERRSVDPVRRGLKQIVASPPRWKAGDTRAVNFYYWYYGTYAVFQAVRDPAHDPRWKAWNKAMLDALLPNQRTGGCEDGSWDPRGEWCLAAGRVYGVAINALTLQIYYRFKRVSEGGQVATAKGR